MKKRIFSVLITAIVCVCLAIAAGCTVDQDGVPHYTVKFYSEGVEVPASQNDFALGSTVEFPEDPVKQPTSTQRFEFKGWSAEENGDEVVVKEECKVTGDANYYAVFDAINIYTVRFFDGDSELTAPKTVYDENESIQFPADLQKAATQTHRYEFKGWATSNGSSETVVKADCKATENINYYAVWETTNIYTVKFMDGTEEVPSAKTTYDEGEKIQFPADPVKEETGDFRYEFAGWSESPSGTDTVNKADCVADGNKTYYAVWTKIGIHYTISGAENTSFVYDGEAHTFAVTASVVSGEEEVSVQYKTDADGEYSNEAPQFTAVGSYTIYYKLTADGYDPQEGSFTVECTKAENSLTGLNEVGLLTHTAVYNGQEISIDLSQIHSDFGEISVKLNDQPKDGVVAIKNAGEYKFDITVAGTANYDGVTESVTITISKADYTAKPQNQSGYTYNGNLQGEKVQIEGVNGEKFDITVDGDYQFTNAGTHTVNYSVTGNGNYNDIESASYTVEIAKKTVTVTGAQTENIEKTYDGNVYTPVKPNVDGLITDDHSSYLSEVKITLSGGDFSGEIKNAGVYTISYTLTLSENYAYDGATKFEYTVTINKANYTVSGVETQNYTYNGDPQGENNITVKGVKDETFTATVDEYQFTNAGTHTVTYSVTGNENYNDIESASYTVEIAKAKAEYSSAVPSFEVKMEKGKTLESLTLGENLKWQAPETAIALGSNQYNALYNPDDANYEDSEPISVTVNATQTTVKVAAKDFEADFGVNDISEIAKNSLTYTDEEDKAISADKVADFIKVNVTTAPDYKTGGTYSVAFKVTCEANDYYKLSDDENNFTVVFKLKSVDVQGKLYTIEDALNIAVSGDTITVKYNTSFAAENSGFYSGEQYYTVKEGVTLLLPYDQTQDEARGVGASGATNKIPGFNGTTHKDSATWTHSSINDAALKDLELSVPDNLEIFNKGTINVGGITTGSNGGSYPAGQTCSGYAQITLGKGVVITSTGNIVSLGFIKEKDKDNNSKLVLNAGTLNMPFVVIEHRGGTKFSNIYDNMLGAPFNRFYLQNVTCGYEVHDGASVFGHANMYASSSDNSTDVKFIGGEGYFIQLQSNAYVKAKYDTSTQVTEWNMYGSININALSLSISIATLSTSGIMFPLSWYHNFYFHAINTAPATVDATAQDMKILPGGQIFVDKNVTFKINKLFVYDKDFKDPASSIGDVAAPFYESNKGEGQLIINGALEAQELCGYVQTSADGAKLKITKADSCSYEVVNAASLAWKSYIKNVTGKIWNNNNTLSANAQTISAGEFTSKNGGWITYDSQFALKFVYGYQDENGDSTISPAELSPNANNPAYFTMRGLKLTPASLDGYEFVGWYSDDNFHDAISEINGMEYEQHLDGSVMNIYGLFKKLPADIHNFTVELIANNAAATISGQSTIKVNVRNDKLDAFKLEDYIPELENYNFIGWFKEAEGVSHITDLKAEDFTENNLKLYAKWEINKYSLTINLTLSSDTTGTIEVKVNDDVKCTATQAGQNVIEVPFGAKVQITVTPGDDCIIESIVSTPEGYVVASGDIFNMPAQALEINVAIEEDGGWCLAEGTLILMADGTTKKIEDLQIGDMVVVFNHETGKYEAAPLLYNVHSGDTAELANVVRLKFTDGTEIDVAYKHFLYDLDLNRYVMITVENARDYIGHKFAKVSEVNGEYKTVGITLYDVVVKEEYVRYFSPVSVYHTNIIAEGLLTYTTWPVLGNPEGFMNYFTFDADMKYNSEAMEADIEKYGLYTYADFEGVLSEAAFNVGPWKYFKVAVGKGQLTWHDILCAIDWLYNSGELDAL